MSEANNEISKQPVVLVTGSARRIGAGINEWLHQCGFNTVIHCHQSLGDAQRLASKLNQRREDSATVIQVDLATAEAPGIIKNHIDTHYGRLDCLVNNASAFYPTPVGTASQADWDTVFATNARAPFFLSQALSPLLQKHQGNIISILDIHIDVPLREHTLYSMAKAAHQTMVKSLARELAPDIRVNGVAPGAILWPENAMNTETRQAIVERVLLRRAGEPDDIAKAVAFLALDAPYITGHVLTVDGGRSLHR